MRPHAGKSGSDPPAVCGGGEVKQRATAIDRRGSSSLRCRSSVSGTGKSVETLPPSGGGVEIHVSVAGQADIDAAAGGVKATLLAGLPAQRDAVTDPPADVEASIGPNIPLASNSAAGGVRRLAPRPYRLKSIHRW